MSDSIPQPQYRQVEKARVRGPAVSQLVLIGACFGLAMGLLVLAAPSIDRAIDALQPSRGAARSGPQTVMLILGSVVWGILMALLIAGVRRAWARIRFGRD